MSWPQRLGNGLCCALIRLLWQAPVNDLGPLRAVRAATYRRLNMSAGTYGWTIEMQVRALELGVSYAERPVQTLPRPFGESKVSPTLAAALRVGRVMLRTIATLYLTRRKRGAISDSALPKLTPEPAAAPTRNPT
jgi:hypothetical protein